MEKALLSEEDVLRTVAHCESSGDKIMVAGKGYCGHLSIGRATCWVEYTLQNGHAVLQNVYAHRLEIQE
ncbi:hypothetical protein LJC56_03880 [Christensenellaceae bacterium OttesenSCG-928-K19]|nr:hypothetical protein [Christensenellaceae bacterium OttesenSCG-928-K19]